MFFYIIEENILKEVKYKWDTHRCPVGGTRSLALSLHIAMHCKDTDNFIESKQYEQNFLISKEKATAICILSAVCWSVCAPCHHGQPSILPSSQPHVSNSKTSFTDVHGTGLTGLAQCSEASLQCYFGS